MPTILVVDDSPVDRKLVGGLLQDSLDVTVRFAEDGAKGLEAIQASLPDLVVTDLLMPEIDGLELVTKIRLQYPSIPVILMTARGSETLAIQALQQGAASYVPKSQLAQKLGSTVAEVLAQARVSQTYDRLLRCQQRIEFDYALENDVALIDALVDLVKKMISGSDLCDHTGRFRIGAALREALLNALYRGNLEISTEEMAESRENFLDDEQAKFVAQRRSQPPYCDRKIHVHAAITDDEASFTVRDEGPGFDCSSIAAASNIAELASLEQIKGRGLVLIHSFMDEVSYNDAGNQIGVVKRRE